MQAMARHLLGSIGRRFESAAPLNDELPTAAAALVDATSWSPPIERERRRARGE